MKKAKTPSGQGHVVLEVPHPGQLSASLQAARQGFWAIIRAGGFQTPEQAEAAVKAWGHVDKALELLEGHLSQLPLPLKDEK